jgi:3,4-dihydroxy 2-butanone 4-phosphate synthase/GTP cyclohydrolase II
MTDQQVVKKIYGTTVFIGELDIDTIYGKFKTYTFQDLINKGYIIALCHGDINSNVLYTRMHSSCVTSETLRSLDCDCVAQLNGAVKKIAESDGILFYLIQEGRGCGYVGKSRACMMVQYKEDTEDEINTFQAYESLGMRHDYRNYTNVKDICCILNINPEFILLTNNPDKIEKFTNAGLRLKCVESIEINPNPFNQQYLHSKQKYGHILYQTKTKVSKYCIPYTKVEPFEPYALPNCRRFIKVSSYYLPIKPVADQVVLTESEFEYLKENEDSAKNFQYQILGSLENNVERSYYVRIGDPSLFEKYKDILCKPYWFKVNVFYDLITSTEYLILEYGDLSDRSKVPLIRIHSESIFNRFPLRDREYKHRYKISLERIIRNGCGMIVILYNDGRGSGLGYYILNNQEHPQTNIGVQTDRRDYYGAVKLLLNFINPNNPIDILHGDTSKDMLVEVFADHQITVRNWINIIQKTDHYGHDSIYNRIIQLEQVVEKILNDFDRSDELDRLKGILSIRNKICVTGIGSSEAHAKYLVYLMRSLGWSIRFVEAVGQDICEQYDRLIVFTQGLSPNISIPIERFGYQNIILITSYTEDGSDEKRCLYRRIKNDPSNLIIGYDKETDDNTLIRITGPIVGYIIGLEISRQLDPTATYQRDQIMRIIRDTSKMIKISERFITNLVGNRKLLILVDPPEKEYIANIKNKFMEGVFVDVVISDRLEFAHGVYQMMEYNRMRDVQYSVILICRDDSEQNKKLDILIKNMLGNYPVHQINIASSKEAILEIEINVNYIVFQLMQLMMIDQKNWFGKNDQHIMYNVNTI